jgi:coenzyme Q-binding protein COQ10
MPKFSSERHVAHSAGDMFNLVGDVEAYPDFVPLCQSLVVRGRGMDDGKEVLVADMTVAYQAISQSLTTRVVLDRQGLTIDVSYLDGPFHHLDSRWTFAPEDAGRSIIRFSIDYEFRSRILATLMGAVFERAFRKFAEAFEERADAIYGTAIG